MNKPTGKSDYEAIKKDVPLKKEDATKPTQGTDKAMPGSGASYQQPNTANKPKAGK